MNFELSGDTMCLNSSSPTLFYLKKPYITCLNCPMTSDVDARIWIYLGVTKIKN